MDFELVLFLGVASLGSVAIWAFFHFRGKWSRQSRDKLQDRLQVIDTNLSNNLLTESALFSSGKEQRRLMQPLCNGGTLKLTQTYPNGSTIELFDEDGLSLIHI